MPLVERTFTVLGYMRTIITTDYGESRANFGEFWERSRIRLSLHFLGRRGRGAQKIRTYVARAVWPPQTWASLRLREKRGSGVRPITINPADTPSRPSHRASWLGQRRASPPGPAHLASPGSRSRSRIASRSRSIRPPRARRRPSLRRMPATHSGRESPSCRLSSPAPIDVYRRPSHAATPRARA